MSLQVIGAGVARTGTTSLKVALEHLLGGRCYHMHEVFRHPGHIAAWHAAVRGEEPDWETLLGDFVAAVDFPAAAFWRSLSDSYPDALVILSVRESADAWYRSANGTINELLPDSPTVGDSEWHSMAHDLLRTRFAPAPFQEEEAKAAYERHNAKVRSAIPPERLLEWKPGDGWDPLCEKLGVPVPDEPFPRLNTTDEYRGVLATLKAEANRQPLPTGGMRNTIARSIDVVAQPARRLVISQPRVRSTLAKARSKLPRPSPTEPIARVIFEFARAYPDATFVQVGANDGVEMDPLRAEVKSRRWRGIMVEPVPYVFSALRENYGQNPRIALENAAITDTDGSRELFYLAEADPGAPDLPDWYDNLGTFHREVIVKHRPAIPDFDERLRTREVPCLTFRSLCRKHGLDSLDLIQIDTEGHDFEILKLVDLDSLRPRIVMYEHLHLDETARTDCSSYMRQHGYEEVADAVNTLCLRTVDLTRRDRALYQLWEQLREPAMS